MSSTTPSSSPAGGHDREVAKAAVEHLEQHLAGRGGRRCTCRRAPTSRPRPARRRSGRPATTRVRRSRSVRIPSSPSPSSTTTERCPGGGHQPRRLPDRRLGPADHRLAASSVPTGWSARLRAGSRASRCSSVGGSSSERATNRRPCGRGEQLLGDARRDPVADGVLGGAGLEAGREARQHRCLAEQLAFAEQVQHLAVGHDLDRAAADHSQVPTGRRPAQKTSSRPAAARARRPRRRGRRRPWAAPRTAGGPAGTRASSARSALTAPASRGAAGLRARVLLDHVRAFLADHHRRDTGVDRRQERKDRAVGDPQSTHPRTRRRGSTTAIGRVGAHLRVQAGCRRCWVHSGCRDRSWRRLAQGTCSPGAQAGRRGARPGPSAACAAGPRSSR